MSLSASVMILLTLFIRKTLSGKLSGRFMAALWLIPAAKLTVPCARGFCTLLNRIIYALGLQRYMYLDYSLERGAFSSVKDGYVFIADRYFMPFVLNLGLELPRAAVYIWLAGAVFAGARSLFGHIRFRRSFACSLPCGYDISEIKSAFGIRRRVDLRISELADSPFTYGVLRPVIILPKITDMNNGEQLRNILCHELAHIKRFDVLFKALLAVCGAAHWFNPLVRVMRSFAVRDMELACDEAALLHGKASPEEYAFALIGAEERRSLYQSVCFGGGDLEERIIGIMSQGKISPHIRRAVSAIAAAGVLIAALAVNVAVFAVTEEASCVMESVAVSGDCGSSAVSIAEADFVISEVIMVECAAAEQGSYAITFVGS